MSARPLVAVVMGSTSDWSTMCKAVEVLTELGHSPADIDALRAAGIVGPHR